MDKLFIQENMGRLYVTVREGEECRELLSRRCKPEDWADVRGGV
jgi:hypothetical protein